MNGPPYVSDVFVQVFADAAGSWCTLSNATSKEIAFREFRAFQAWVFQFIAGSIQVSASVCTRVNYNSSKKRKDVGTTTSGNFTTTSAK